MADFTFTEKAMEQYIYWQTQDRKTLKKINSLITDIKRNGAMQGIGKPELLKHDKSGLYSRRIDEANRLIYGIDESQNIKIRLKNGKLPKGSFFIYARNIRIP